MVLICSHCKGKLWSPRTLGTRGITKRVFIECFRAQRRRQQRLGGWRRSTVSSGWAQRRLQRCTAGTRAEAGRVSSKQPSSSRGEARWSQRSGPRGSGLGLVRPLFRASRSAELLLFSPENQRTRVRFGSVSKRGCVRLQDSPPSRSGIQAAGLP